ncbi:hypothetical protein LZ30DRAFT_773513 [Colletotrichum cereale]|nr:hypothetical protein LZ30DRAFT_773513 [Colletotrichum cereale]
MKGSILATALTAFSAGTFARPGSYGATDKSSTSCVSCGGGNGGGSVDNVLPTGLLGGNKGKANSGGSVGNVLPTGLLGGSKGNANGGGSVDNGNANGGGSVDNVLPVGLLGGNANGNASPTHAPSGFQTSVRATSTHGSQAHGYDSAPTNAY